MLTVEYPFASIAHGNLLRLMMTVQASRVLSCLYYLRAAYARGHFTISEQCVLLLLLKHLLILILPVLKIPPGGPAMIN